MALLYHIPLSPEDQLLHGLAAPQALAMADRVRFSELDGQNHVNNKAYMTWFESLRVAYSRHFCAPFYGDGAPPRFLVHSLNLRFVREMLMGEDYIATANVTAFRRSSYTMEQQLWSGDLRARMSVVVVLGAPDGKGRFPLPEALKAEFVSRDGATNES